jgi:hypothetical protein
MKNKQIILEEISHKLKLCQRDIKTIQERLSKDFNKEISWTLKPLFKANQWAEILIIIIKDEEDNGIKLDDKIEYHINYLEDFLNQPSNARRNSSCKVTNITSGWRFKTNMEILKFLKTIQTKTPSKNIPPVKKVVSTLPSAKIREVRTRRRYIGDGSSTFLYRWY